MPSVANLPSEIITFHLFPLLDKQTLLSLVLACDVDVNEKVYNRYFDDKTWFASYNRQMFLERAGCSLYSCLTEEGLYDYDPSPDKIYAPRKVEAITGMVTQECASTRDMRLVTSKGRLFTCEVSNVFEDKPLPDLHVYEYKGRRDVSDDYCEDNAGLVRFSQPYFESPGRSTFFVQVSCGSQTQLALDSQGLLWRWRHLTDQAVVLQGKISPRILRLRMNDWYATYQVEDKGILVLTGESRTNGWRAGYPCYNGHLCRAKTFTVPQTAEGVRDYALTRTWLVSLDNKGSVSGWFLYDHVRSHRKQPLQKDSLLEINTHGPFVLINSNSENVVMLVRADGCIVLADLESSKVDRHVEVIDAFAADGVASVCSYYDYFYALTCKGEVYMWTKRIFADWNTEEGKSSKPTKIDLPGRAYGIFGGIPAHCGFGVRGEQYEEVIEKEEN